MRTRKLGNSDLEVSAIGFGCMGLNFSYDHSLSKENRLHRLEENLAAADVALAPDDLTMIESAAAEIQVEGERYPAHLIATTGR